MTEPSQIQDIAPAQAPRQGVNVAFAVLRALLPTSSEKTALTALATGTLNTASDDTTVTAQDPTNSGAVGPLRTALSNLYTIVTSRLKIAGTLATVPALRVVRTPGACTYKPVFTVEHENGTVLFSVRDDGYVVMSSFGVSGIPNLNGVNFPSGSAAPVNWWDGAGNSDVGLIRTAAGVLRVTNGVKTNNVWGYGTLDTAGTKVNGVSVVGTQQSAIPNSDGSQTDNARAINALLAAMRAHGLIAT